MGVVGRNVVCQTWYYEHGIVTSLGDKLTEHFEDDKIFRNSIFFLPISSSFNGHFFVSFYAKK